MGKKSGQHWRGKKKRVGRTGEFVSKKGAAEVEWAPKVKWIFAKRKFIVVSSGLLESCRGSEK